MKKRVINLKFQQTFYVIKKDLAGLKVRLNGMASDKLKVISNLLRNKKASD